MKKILTALLCLFSISLFAQEETASDIKKKMWSDGTNVEASQIEKWKEESAIVLYQYFGYDYERTRGDIKRKESFRTRVLLQDKAALKEYSEFSFSQYYGGRISKRNRSAVYVGFKIVKPDGKEVEVDLTEAVELDADGGVSRKKIAIPDLQEGDILDYYYYSIYLQNSGRSFEFEPVINSLNSTYPIVEQKIEFIVEEKFYINFKSTNGAPDLKKSYDEENERYTYTLISKNQEKEDPELWSYPLLEQPTIKFQVIYAKNSKTNSVFSFLEKGKFEKKSVTKNDIIGLVNYRLKKDKLSKQLYPQFKYHIKKNGYKKFKDMSDLEKVKAYYDWEKTAFSTHYFLNFYIAAPDFPVSTHFMLKKMRIPHELVLVVPRSIGSLDDLILGQELVWIIRANIDGEIYYLPHVGSPFTGDIRYFDEIPYYLQGAEAYSLPLSSGASTNDLKKITLPVSKSEDNKAVLSTLVSLNEDMKSLKLNRTLSCKGYPSKFYQKNILNIESYIKFLDDNYKEDTRVSAILMNVKNNPSDFGQLKENQQEKLEEFLKKNIEGDYNVEPKDYKHKLLQPGYMDKSRGFKIEEDFTLEGLVKKAGPNYTLKIGQMITNQIEVDPDEKDRKYEIQMSCPRTYEADITLEIPKGYTVAGLEKLNMNVENETGSFVSTAVIEGNELKIDTKKVYKHQKEPKENWNEMLEFLDAAYQFTQVQVLLKKQ